MANENEIQEGLLVNPKYSSDWIKCTTQLIANGDMDEETAAKYIAPQLTVLSDAIRYCKDKGLSQEFVECISNPELNDTQMRVLFIAFQNGAPIDVIKFYANPEIPYDKINYLLSAMTEEGVDLRDYVDFRGDQIYEIYAGVKDHVDYTAYAYKEIAADEMSLLRHAMAIGKSISYDTKTKEMILK
jgi:hypothetical protein